jgi:glyoxylase-like metal-dependent hydrolase (beta-lactamase superfamily II)
MGAVFTAPFKFKKMRFGKIEIFPIVENSFKIDGGAMFGIIPKVMWEKLVTADVFNRVTLDLNVFLIKASGKNILIDTGMGNALTEKQKKLFGIEKDSQLENELSNLGLKPEDIDYVILSHLHSDHAGGIVNLNQNGEKTPQFPKAKHIVQKKEWELALEPDERTAATYFVDNLKLLEKENLWQLVEGEVEILPEIKVLNSGGHTGGHQAVLISSNKEKILYPGDVIPTSYHLKTAYVAGVDLFPVETMKKKKDFIERCLHEGWYIAFDHDVNIKIGKIKKVESELSVEKIL